MLDDELTKRLDILTKKLENQTCVDCNSRFPSWASIIVPPPGSPLGSKPIGAFCCTSCAGSHRGLGVHVSFVRSVKYDTWKEHEVLAMENGGNDKVNAIFEANYCGFKPERPHKTTDGSTRQSFIRAKYEKRMFYDPSLFAAYAEGRDIPKRIKAPRKIKVEPSMCEANFEAFTQQIEAASNPIISSNFMGDTRIRDSKSFSKKKKKGKAWFLSVRGVRGVRGVFRQSGAPTFSRKY